MHSTFAAALRAVAVAAALLASAAQAHEGHDHGVAAPSLPIQGSPRVALHSDAFELVGIVRGDKLGLFLDRYATNEPVTDARISVTLGGDEEVTAEPSPDGTYSVRSAKLLGQGSLELVFALNSPAGDDLLIGTVELPAKPAAMVAAPAPPGAALLASAGSLRIGRVEVPTPYFIAAVTLALGFLLGLAVRSRSKLVPAGAIGFAILLVSTAYALAHEGHDHGAEAGRAALPTGDTPRRLGDGTLFVPKPSQRLLNVRTIPARADTAHKTITLIGRVVADPNRSGLVQSINGGRVSAPEGGLPRIGQTVRKGDVLAIVEPAVPQADRTTIAERLGEIEQLISVSETKLRRIRGLAERGISPQSQVVDAETELEGLKRRRDVLRQTRIEPEVLRAPIDGTVTAARVVPGQVVSAQDPLFQIIDARGLLVEALVYGEADPSKLSRASAIATDGVPLALAFRGFSKALQQQATVVQFSVEGTPGGLSVGQPVTVVAQHGDVITGIILPRDAVVRGGNGEALVWRHTDPERFEAKPVRIEPVDASRVVVRAGLAEGDRVVTRGAELVNQIR